MNDTDYHCYDSCNKCSGVNDFNAVYSDTGHIEECETKCTICGFKDYWAYGFFESSQEIESKCKTYNFSQGRKPLPEPRK